MLDDKCRASGWPHAAGGTSASVISCRLACLERLHFSTNKWGRTSRRRQRIVERYKNAHTHTLTHPRCASQHRQHKHRQRQQQTAPSKRWCTATSQVGEMELHSTHKHTGSKRLWAAGSLMDRGVWTATSSFQTTELKMVEWFLRINGREMFKNLHTKACTNVVPNGAFRTHNSIHTFNRQPLN